MNYSRQFSLTAIQRWSLQCLLSGSQSEHFPRKNNRILNTIHYGVFTQTSLHRVKKKKKKKKNDCLWNGRHLGTLETISTKNNNFGWLSIFYARGLVYSIVIHFATFGASLLVFCSKRRKNKQTKKGKWLDRVLARRHSTVAICNNHRTL